MERKKGLAAELLELGVRLAIDASEKLLGDPRGQEAVAAASDLAQKAVRKLEELQASAVRAAAGGGAPSREELRELEEQVRRIQQQARDLAARLDAMARAQRAGRPGPTWRDPEDMEPR